MLRSDGKLAMKTLLTLAGILITNLVVFGQSPVSTPAECTKNVSFAVAEGGQPVPAIPKFAAKWIDKKLHKQDYRGLCFSQIPSSSTNNYVVIFSTSEAMFEGLTPSAHTYTSTAPDAGNVTKASSYGGTWSYAYAGVPPPKTTTTLDLQRDDKPKSLFARAYNQQGRLLTSYSLAGFPSREKLLEYVLAAISGDAPLPTKQMPKAVPLSVYYVNCDVDSPAVQLAMTPPPKTPPAEPPHPQPPPPPPPMPLEIWSSPAGADISLDGMNIGKTPHSLVVPPGEHTITLRKPEFATWQRTVRADPNQRRVTAYLERKSLDLAFPSAPTPPAPAPKDPGSQAVLDFWSSPTGADIFVDGEYVGKTPYSFAVAPGQHAIALRKKDFGTWQRKLVVDAGQRKVGASLEQKSLALQ
jgi:PEGA domain